MGQVEIEKQVINISRNVPQAMKTDSCRCKMEGRTITLGISLPVLEKMAINMNIEHLGGRITPR